MKEISVKTITPIIAEMCINSNIFLPKDVKNNLECFADRERNESAKDTLGKILQNIDIAVSEKVPLCQDTGLCCVFLEIGQEVHFIDGSLTEAINAGVKTGYEEGYLRKSVVRDPLQRVNTGDNTPAAITTEIVPGDKFKIMVAPKGFGSENMSRLVMLPPSAGKEGVENFVIETVKLAGANPCPPIVVGVGIGGTFDKVAYLAKKALMRPLDKRHTDPFYSEMEEDLLRRINSLDIGPQGFGGDTTALGVNIEVFPTHIAGLPVAVNINCHVTRHIEYIL